MDQQPPSFEYLTPPEPAAAPVAGPRLLGLPRFALGLAAGAVLLVVAGAAAVTVFILAAGHGTVLDRMVPAGAVGYASVNLDPPADQKLDLLNLSHKLPKLSTQQQTEQSLDDALKSFGLSYSGDVKPWLGAQIVGLAGAGAKPAGAVLFDSKDDAAAQRTLTKLETKFARAGWHSATHGGVTLRLGSQDGQTVVLAYFDHTLLVASSEALADEVIDTDQGKHARLDSTAEYRTVTGRLPASRLVTVFVDGHGLSSWAQGLLKSVASPLPNLGPSLDPSQVDQSLAAYRGFGFAVAARGDGLAADFETDVDTSKLTAGQRAIYERGASANGLLRHVPAGAVAVVGLTDLDLIFKGLAASPQASSMLPPQVAQATSKLTGDAVVEVEGSGRTLGVGAVIGTSDPEGLRATVQQLAGDLTGVYFGTSGGSLLVASTPVELQRLQAADGGFLSSAGYSQAAGYAVDNPTAIVYVDVQGAFRLAGSFGLQSSDLQQAQSDWSAVKSVLITSSPRSARVHLVIG